MMALRLKRSDTSDSDTQKRIRKMLQEKNMKLLDNKEGEAFPVLTLQRSVMRMNFLRDCEGDIHGVWHSQCFTLHTTEITAAVWGQEKLRWKPH